MGLGAFSGTLRAALYPHNPRTFQADVSIG